MGRGLFLWLGSESLTRLLEGAVNLSASEEELFWRGAGGGGELSHDE